jgi:adenylate kinase
MRHRLEVYHESTEPLIRYYTERGLIAPVDGAMTIAEVAEQIFGILDAKKEAEENE